MEILKRGTLPSERKYVGKCNTCKTEVGFAQAEGTYHCELQAGEWVDVACPVCGDTISGREEKDRLRIITTSEGENMNDIKVGDILTDEQVVELITDLVRHADVDTLACILNDISVWKIDPRWDDELDTFLYEVVSEEF